MTCSHLLATRRLGPLFVTQFLGAANDNLFKNALVVMVVYGLADTRGVAPPVLGALAAAVFILPFFLFSATAGVLADRFDKAWLIRWVKAAEILVAALAAPALLAGDAWALLGVLTLLGAQATFFGPLKYAILPEHLAPGELVAGNALVEAGTFVAILLGTIAGGLLAMVPHGAAVVAGGMMALALGGFAASWWIPAAPVADPSLRVGLNFISETKRIVRQARQRREVWLSILGISWFWLVGATFLTQFAAFAREVLHADNQVVTLFLTVFSLGVGLGSLACARLLHGEISARWVPAATLAMTVFALDFALSAPAAAAEGQQAGLAEFLARPAAWRVLADLLLVSMAGGVYAVPLYAIVQARSDEHGRARAVAANNVMNALFMATGAAVTALLLAVGLPVAGVFVVLAAANGVVTVLVCALLPETVLKALLAGLLRLLFRVRVRGLEHMEELGPRVLVVANHVSLVDVALLAAFLPGRLTYAVNSRVARWWWVAPFLRVVEALEVDPAHPRAVRTLTRAVEAGRRVVIFPEGRITVTGGLMKIYDGTGMIADKAHAQLLPVRIAGAERSLFSYLGGKVRRRLFPRVTLTILPPQRLDVPKDLRGRARRRVAGRQVADLLAEALFRTADLERTLPQALLAAMREQGGRLEDPDRQPVSLRRLVAGAMVLGRRLAGMAAPGEVVALLLPNAVGTAVAFFALQWFGRVPAMLNLGAGAPAWRAACAIAGMRRVLTSRRFVEAARLEAAVAELSTVVDILYLEDLRAAIGPLERWCGLGASLLARPRGRPDDPAVVLFTSGSEGQPKGVVLSHRNLLANCAQMRARLDLTAADTVFAALPLFHAFGLLGGLVLPLLNGVRSFLYPSPLHYRMVPEMVYDTNATILFGTDTFLAGYARTAHPLDFRSLRYVFGGAEKIRDDTRRQWMDGFGLRILEGYGATETAPALAINTPAHYRAGSAGRFLPGIEWRLAPVEGLERGGRLAVRGPNVMLGYLDPAHPGTILPPPEGWYDTGDIVDVDAEGWVTILGRAKRFAKVAGEMVSLAAVEEAVQTLWPEFQHAVFARPDPRKGEHLVLVTTRPDTDRAALSGCGLSAIALPRTIVVREHLPRLGGGKVDYKALEAGISRATE